MSPTGTSGAPLESWPSVFGGTPRPEMPVRMRIVLRAISHRLLGVADPGGQGLLAAQWAVVGHYLALGVTQTVAQGV